MPGSFLHALIMYYYCCHAHISCRVRNKQGISHTHQEKPYLIKYFYILFQNRATVERPLGGRYIHLLRCSSQPWGRGPSWHFKCCTPLLLPLHLSSSTGGWFEYILQWMGQPSTANRKQHESQPAVAVGSQISPCSCSRKHTGKGAHF